MKKLLAMILALMMALSCAVATAETVYTQVTIDRDVAKALLPGFGVTEDQMAFVDPMLSLVNALGVKVTAVGDGAQVGIELNGKAALDVGWAMDDAGVSVVSTLFPNFIVTVSQETLSAMIEQMMANMPGAGQGGEGGMMDFAAMGEVLGGHFAKWFQACASAGQPGEPVPGEYQFEGVTFDTMVPVTVDMPVIKAATQTLLDDLLADPAAMGMIKGMAQGMAQSSGGEIDDANFEAQFKAGFEEWLAHFPETVTAEFYTDSEGGEQFYMTGESVMEGMEEATFTYDMLYLGEAGMKLHCNIAADDGAMDMGFEMEGTDVRMYFDMAGMYFGMNMSFPENEFDMDIFFMNPDAALISLKVTMAEGGERTIGVDAEGKTVVAVEDLMNDQSGEAGQALLGDIMGNGLGALMGVLGEEVPEVMNLMSAFGGAMAG